MNKLPGTRDIYPESANDYHECTRETCDGELHQQYSRQLPLSNQGYSVQFPKLIPSTSLRDDGLRFDLSFVVVDDNDRVRQSEGLCFRTHQTSFNSPNDSWEKSNQHLLEYIELMEENYANMKRELMRAKILASFPDRQTVFCKQQPKANWEVCSLARKCGCPSDLRTDLRMHEEGTGAFLIKNPEDSTKKPCKPAVCRPKIVNGNAVRTAVCSIHNIAVILLQDDLKETNDDLKTGDKCVGDRHAVKIERNCPASSNRPCIKATMETCQTFDRKQELEISWRTDIDVKHEDYTQTSSINRDIPQSQLCNGAPGYLSNASTRKSKLAQPNSVRQTSYQRVNTNDKENCYSNQAYRPCMRSAWKDRVVRRTPYQRNSRTNDNLEARNYVRTALSKNVSFQKRQPTLRSHVHTAYSPLIESASSNHLLDTNGYSIQLLRLAVLLYAPTLMPALNALIARQDFQTSIPIPFCEGSNEVLAQVFRILNGQICIPNLSYTSTNNYRVNQRLDLPKSNSQNSQVPQRQRITVQLQDTYGSTSSKLKSPVLKVPMVFPQQPRECYARSFRGGPSRKTGTHTASSSLKSDSSENAELPLSLYNQSILGRVKPRINQKLLSAQSNAIKDIDEDTKEITDKPRM